MSQPYLRKQKTGNPKRIFELLIDEPLLDKVKALARKEDKNASWIIRDLIREGLENMGSIKEIQQGDL